MAMVAGGDPRGIGAFYDAVGIVGRNFGEDITIAALEIA